MSILDTVYASAPDGIVLIPTIELNADSFSAPIRNCAGFEDITVGLGDENLVTGWEEGFIDIGSTDGDLNTSVAGARTTAWFSVWPSARYRVDLVSGEMDRRRVQWRMSDGSIQYDGYAGGPGFIQASAGARQARVYYSSSEASSGTIAVRADDDLEFIASGLDVSLPAKDESGQQNLVFAIENVTGEAQSVIETALENRDIIQLIYRLYLSNDLSEPAELPRRMIVTEAQFRSSQVQVTASYNDIIGRAWPRRRYTPQFAPGLRYV